MSPARASRWASILGGTLGILYLVLGVLELVTHLDEPMSLFFWIPALVGGGVLVLVGVFHVTRPRWLSVGLVATGLFAATLATAWTIVVPVAALFLAVLVVLRPEPPAAT